MAKETFLFLGDSLIADFDWQKRMSHFEILNYGVPGETTKGLLKRIPTIIKEVDNPGLILLMVGTNNLIIEDYSFVSDLQKIIVKLTSRYPTTEVITNSLLPCKLPWVSTESLEKINKQIDPMTQQTGSCYLDMYSKFKSHPEYFQGDGVHLTPKAYDIWAKCILEFVSFLIEDD